MPTRPEGPCPAKWHFYVEPNNEHIIGCGGEVGHAGPHQDPTAGIYWSDRDWFTELANQPHATDPKRQVCSSWLKDARGVVGCDMTPGHLGPHHSPRHGDWEPHPDDVPQLVDQPEPFDPLMMPWESITIDGLTIPARMIRARDLVTDLGHGRITMTLKAQDSVTVNYLDTSGKAETFGAPRSGVAE